ncbi:thiamine pyrophosphate-dependent dehydrogenase E1 component subunit alpha [Acanthopleuribacter pedis]|uniref:2-oxoisovalerate dehydrogenase subunit alpha n=1 Tax=Acanthopleuribacter pedis TaxID=442870 RepID=A0A8J7Q098_9BACT|nr:thiamine pyrophosphate-dependent dehydrogenase E1 component subunit alpha [Acanthopleuribacter pedis]MBO1316875.1 thiamine pyrophosphate-dependent dehydrogenase E1 component subunit alpha [Acanthopleuribacter pedis]
MDKELKVKILDLMIEARCMEERMVKMSKSTDGFFWLGGVGEEAFNVPLGLLAKRGHGLDYDFFHFHYRNGATMIALGMDPADELRQMHNRVTDPFSGGRNFCNHYVRKAWNVVPVTSTIQTQCSVAPGTARAQKRHGGDGITIVTFGDAGTAEGDFHVGLNWSTLPKWELPLLWICTNNAYGISTPYDEVHGQEHIANIVAGYGIPTKVINGNDVEESYNALKEAMDYCRTERKPYYLEAMVSRLHGHSSSSGANRVPDGLEADPLFVWIDRLVAEEVIEKDYFDKKYAAETQRMKDLLAEVRKEPAPTAADVFKHIYAEA